MASKGTDQQSTNDHHQAAAPAGENEPIEVVETVDHRKTAGQQEPTTEPVEVVHEHPNPNEEGGVEGNHKPSSKEKVTVVGKKALAGAAEAVNKTVESAKEAVSGDKKKKDEEEEEQKKKETGVVVE